MRTSTLHLVRKRIHSVHARRQQAGNFLSSTIKNASDITTASPHTMDATDAEMENYEDAQALKKQIQGQKKLDAKERLARRLRKQKAKAKNHK